MSETEMFDFAVVGAGIAGASVGWQLARAGASVVVLEREAQPGYHSTGRSAAMFMESYGTEHTRALTRASRAFFLRPPTGFSEHPVLSPRGVLYVGQAGQEPLLEAAHAAYVAQGLRVKRLSATEALEKVPCLKPDALVGAVWDEDAADMDVDALHQGYLKGMKQHGGALKCQSPVLSVEWDEEGWYLTLKGKDAGAQAPQSADDPDVLPSVHENVVRAKVLVNAAGAWADELARLAGVRPLGLVPKRRSAFLFAPPDGLDVRGWPTVLGVDESYYFKPDAGMLLGSPANADPVEPHDVVAEEWDVALGIHQITEATTLTIRRPSHTWAGLRTFAPDSELVIGWDADVDDFFWLVGQGGYGIQTSAGASELAASLLLRQSLPVHLRQFGVSPAVVDPARFRL
ncbi:MAG: FAD-dependent oxidoreductase [Lautropia sp.]|nr:FAD-dependent oxidoreductase [Lautropia sp.]